MPITEFSVLNAGSSKAHMGYVANRSAFVDPDKNPAFVVRDLDGQTKWGVMADGKLVGSKLALQQFVTQDGHPPALNPGEICIWGDAAAGIVYLVYYDGLNFNRTKLGSS